MKQHFIKAVNYLNFTSILFLCATSIYYYPIQRIGFYLFFASFFLEIILEKKWLNIQMDKMRIYFMVLFFFFLLALIYCPFESSTKYTKILLEKRIPLLGFAIVGFFGVNSKFKLNYFLNTFIISSILTILYLIFIRIGIIEFISNPQRIESFKIVRNLYVNSHMLFDFYLNISLISVWYILTRSWNRTTWWKRYLYIISLSIIFCFLSISEGRSGFILGIILMLSFIFFEIWKKRKALGIIIGLLIPFLLIGIVSNHKRMDKKSIETEARLFLWQSGVSVIKEKPIFGYGISDAQEAFDIARRKYQTEEFRVANAHYKHLDCHNQFLQTTMEFGIFGLLILLFLYIYPVFVVENNRKLFSLFLLFLCAYQSVFDMLITGPFSSLFGILIIMLLSVKNNIVKTSEKKIQH